MNHPPARLITRRIAALLKTSGGYRFRDVVAAALCAVITLIAMQWLMAFDAANPVMLYLLGVVVVALFYGRASVVATVING